MLKAPAIFPALALLAACAVGGGRGRGSASTANVLVEPALVGSERNAAASCVDSIPRRRVLVRDHYTADPSAHVFDGTLYVYPSHDIDAGIPADNAGSHFAMEDYHVYSFARSNCSVTDHGVALHVDDVPWAKRQMWAPDAAFKDGTYYLYFPARDGRDVFRIGVATSPNPSGPFTPEPSYIPGTFSIDPAVFIDDDGTAYLYFGGLMGGQLEKWQSGSFDPDGQSPPASEPAIPPRVGVLSGDMKRLVGSARPIRIVADSGDAIAVGDEERRFFEAAWVHKYAGTYYFSYSTGTTHYIAYATGTSATGPFTYRGRILEPVAGWTNHHSIVEYGGKWLLFYHDAKVSGQTHLRNVRVTELTHAPNGDIVTITP